MANAEHVKVLKEGYETWNRWRDQSPDVRPELAEANLEWAEIGAADLGSANLVGARLRGARLSRARLYRAEMAGADLSAAHLVTADLTGANLQEARLSSAELRWAELLITNLYKADLRWADLTSAHLVGADLTTANLEEADLRGANLREANLFGANLHGADLRWADLRASDLRETNLAEAHLTGVEFSGAQLAGASLAGSHLGYAIFGDVDLSGARDLAAVHHRGPSTIGLDSVWRSRGRIPDVFMRGCGLPDEVIALVHWLAQHPPQPRSCVISHATADEDLALRLWQDLQESNIRCWLSPDATKGSDQTRLASDERIRIDDALIVVLSKASIDSDWIAGEVEQALELEREADRRILYAVEVDNVAPGLRHGWGGHIKDTRAIHDFRFWDDPTRYEEAYAGLLQDIQAEGPQDDPAEEAV